MNFNELSEYQNPSIDNQESQSFPEMIGGNQGRFRKIDKAPTKKNENFETDWLSVSKYEAETDTLDKVSRVMNNLAFGAAIYGFYSFTTGGTGIIDYASYLSMGLAARKIASTTIGYLVYPAAITSFPCCGKGYLEKQGKREILNLEDENFIVRKIALYKSGTKYDAVLITHQDTIVNGNWTINALGNGMTMECFISGVAKENFRNKCNTLLINGPSVSHSGGWPTRYQMGAGFEVGLKFLEREVRATHIIMHGFSLGSGMIGEAILTHDFTEGMKKDIRYLSISDRSFSRLSSIAAALVGKIVKPIFYLTGTELDGVGAALKLSQLGIRQIVIQHRSKDGTGSDHVIPDNCSLAYELHKDSTFENKIFLESESITHNGLLPRNIEESLKHEIQEFIES